MTAYEQAAIRALKKRDEGKAADNNAQEALQDKADKKATSLKRPAAAMAPTTGSEAQVVLKGSPRPKLGAGPQAYKGARIYVNSAKKGFRVIRDAKDRFSGRFVSWQGERRRASRLQWGATLA